MGCVAGKGYLPTGATQLNTKEFFPATANSEQEARESFVVPGFLSKRPAESFLGVGTDPAAVVITGGEAFGKSISPKRGRAWTPVRKTGSDTVWLLYRMECPYECNEFLKVIEVEVSTVNGNLYGQAVAARFKGGYQPGFSRCATAANSDLKSMKVSTVAISATDSGYGVCNLTGTIPALRVSKAVQEETLHVSRDEEKSSKDDDESSILSAETEAPDGDDDDFDDHWQYPDKEPEREKEPEQYRVIGPGEDVEDERERPRLPPTSPPQVPFLVSQGALDLQHAVWASLQELRPASSAPTNFYVATTDAEHLQDEIVPRLPPLSEETEPFLVTQEADLRDDS